MSIARVFDRLAGRLVDRLAGRLVGRLVVVAALSIVVLTGAPNRALAQAVGTPAKQAGRHFERGVALFNEADYRAALVEFRRAYDISPNAMVLYNIGQTYYQLQNYAAALTTFERFLAEAGTPAQHRAAAESAIETLRTRVGRITIATSAADYEIAIDDEVVGTTPLRDPVLVSIGRRKLTARRAGQVVETRTIDIAAGDVVRVPLTLAEAVPLDGSLPSPAAPRGRGFPTTAWIVTGALGVAALGTGLAAYMESRDLDQARNSFPAMADDLSDRSSRVKTLALVADIATVATVIAGGVALTLTLSRSDSHEVRVSASPGGVAFTGVFP